MGLGQALGSKFGRDQEGPVGPVEYPLADGFKKKYGSDTYQGKPYKGKIYARKEGDPDSKQPVMVSEVHIDNFVTTDSEDIKKWQNVIQRVADGIAIVSFEEKVYDDKIGGWRILLRWADLYYTNPEGV